MSKAYVVNTGIITAIGNDTATCLQSLLEGKTGVGKAEILKTHWQDELPVAEVKLTNEQLAQKTGVSVDWPRTALLSSVAVHEAGCRIKIKQQACVQVSSPPILLAVWT